MPGVTRRFGAIELVQAMQLGHAVAALQALRVTEALHELRLPADLAQEFGVDESMLAGLLDHAARATDLVVRKGRRFRMSKAWNEEARFIVGLYGSAFGRCAADIGELLKHSDRAATRVDRTLHARAFEEMLGPDPAGADPALEALLRQLGALRVLDLGCGPAALLIRLAHEDAGFRGWGIEANAGMRAAARAAARRLGVTRRVTLIEGDARAADVALPAAIASQVQVIVASQFVNEMFGCGTYAVVAWLQALARALPGRLLVVADYYGRLGSALAVHDLLTLIHDHAQLSSGQGVPPARRSDWALLYRAAGASLIHAIEDVRTTRFIHLVKL